MKNFKISNLVTKTLFSSEKIRKLINWEERGGVGWRGGEWGGGVLIRAWSGGFGKFFEKKLAEGPVYLRPKSSQSASI